MVAHFLRNVFMLCSHFRARSQWAAGGIVPEGVCVYFCQAPGASNPEALKWVSQLEVFQTTQVAQIQISNQRDSKTFFNKAKKKPLPFADGILSPHSPAAQSFKEVLMKLQLPEIWSLISAEVPSASLLILVSDASPQEGSLLFSVGFSLSCNED